ncbi:F1F0 ATP synthase subunit j, mitochondrial [Komagataella phaffii CBS 7435]|uniref:Subunit of the mitochondrial F1F0 ATP synthase n=2 Tax=Komagataella phaffii TaxID=460519 RepID=C4R1M8_KOMPG|nr:Subunit of the mitochondrial F1F0 ATP synthase [Komagataella phaffii GS115]CAH2448066.1 F1F0 ATP synthase subunit j, mitochondrial [Komagataella phaffii CBS 7435]CAY69402.1 Subunit of the mitochondrial F1F0 ATP synthase [Komagataella phaffii GS115]SCV12030.1 F1F0 ATP synthase subunit j, mitochondrial [Komagataella phaffii CBS 7435]
MVNVTRYAVPILKPYWTFFAGAGITYYLIGKAANASMNSDEFINDPRHPRFNRGEKVIDIKALP